MAYLKGQQKLVGSVGDHNYYEHENGKTIIRGKGGPDKQKFETSPQMAHTRDRASEFGAAAKIAARIRKAFRDYGPYLRDTTYYNRLVGLLNLVGKTDFANNSGYRDPLEGNCFLLEDFQWNAKAGVGKALATEYNSWIDAATGDMHLEFESFIPSKALKHPSRASHFQLLARGVAVDPEKRTPRPYTAAGPLLPVSDKKATGVISLKLNVPQCKAPGLYVLNAALVFFEQYQGVWSAVRGGSAAITAVEPILPAATKTAAKARPAKSTAKAKPKPPRDRTWLLEEILKKVEGALGDTKAPPGPVIDDQKQKALIDKATRKLKRTKWLAQLDEYRYGK
jgi:hypothetical protein